MALAFVLAAGLLPACGPFGPQGIVAGGPFLGSAEPLPHDATFTDQHMLIAIETRGGWLRHSVTVLCVAAEGRLYVMARHAPRKRWVRDLLADPRVRLEIGGRLYAGRAVRVDGAADEDERIARSFLRKYVGVEVDRARFLAGPPPAGDDRAELWSFRIDPPEGSS
jgi:hypothetical protein